MTIDEIKKVDGCNIAIVDNDGIETIGFLNKEIPINYVIEWSKAYNE